MTDDEQVEEWRRQITIIRDDLTGLNHHRDKMARIFAMVNANPALLAHAGRMILDDWRMYYGTWVAVMLRRETDKADDSISLRTLLESLAKHAGALTESQVRRLWNDPSGQFTSLTTSWPFLQQPSGSLHPSRPEADAAILDGMSSDLRKFVNKMLAHRSSTAQPPSPPTFNDLDAVAKVFEDVAKPYILLLTGASYRFEVVEQFGWMDVFDFAWRRSSLSAQ